MPTSPGKAAGIAQEAVDLARRTLSAFMAEHANLDRIETVGGMLAERFEAGNKALICGNGGSVCDAMHFAEELTGRFRNDRRPLPAIACTDAGHITCVANDYGFEDVFARWVEALGNKGDVLIALSTSGDSRNVLCAVAEARAKGMTTVALLGKYGGLLRGQADHEWIIRPPEGVSEFHSDRIQEVHMLVLHTIIEVVERRLFPENYAS
ncbi:MAG: SIS domain-containing protein [Phycisphaeraceae bacterium]|nr:SIS domain-containing protein [Phycisphaeraceae bacterium]